MFRSSCGFALWLFAFVLAFYSHLCAHAHRRIHLCILYYPCKKKWVVSKAEGRVKAHQQQNFSWTGEMEQRHSWMLPVIVALESTMCHCGWISRDKTASAVAATGCWFSSWLLPLPRRVRLQSKEIILISLGGVLNFSNGVCLVMPTEI